MIQNNLRQKLQEIITHKLDEQPMLIMELKEPHGIELYKQVEYHANITKYHDDDSFNCFMYCFGITYGDIKDEDGYVPNGFPNEPYVIYLIQSTLNKIPDKNDVNNGDFVIYFVKKTPKHAGIYDGGKVISKWGDHSHVWRHELLEVPIKYGDKIEYYTKITSEDCLMAYKQWVKSNRG